MNNKNKTITFNYKTSSTNIFFSVLVMVIFTITGCAGIPVNVGTGLGAVAGGLGGAILGEKLAPGYGKYLGVGIGAIVGATVGGEIAKALDPDEQKHASNATQQALANQKVGSLSTKTWKSATNPEISGSATVTSKIEESNGQLCKTVATLTKLKGQDLNQNEKFCQNTKTGDWILSPNQ